MVSAAIPVNATGGECSRRRRCSLRLRRCGSGSQVAGGRRPAQYAAAHEAHRARHGRAQSHQALRQRPGSRDEQPTQHEQPGRRKGGGQPALAPLTSQAPSTPPIRVPRPPTATQIAISIEFAGCISLGLMIPPAARRARRPHRTAWPRTSTPPACSGWCRSRKSARAAPARRGWRSGAAESAGRDGPAGQVGQHQGHRRDHVERRLVDGSCSGWPRMRLKSVRPLLPPSRCCCGRKNSIAAIGQGLGDDREVDSPMRDRKIRYPNSQASKPGTSTAAASANGKLWKAAPVPGSVFQSRKTMSRAARCGTPPRPPIERMRYIPIA